MKTSAPIEIHWITLIHYKNDVNTENCFQNGGRPPSWIWENFYFWSRDLYLHVNHHLHSEFCVNRPIRDKAPRYSQKQYSIWRPSAILNLKNFDLFVKHACLEWKFASVYQIWSKSDNSRLRYGDKAIFKMEAVLHLEFWKIALLVMNPVLACDSIFPIQISY